MKKFIYIFFGLLSIFIFFSYIIISDKYDKQNLFILKIKEIVPTKVKNKLRNVIYESRANLNEKEIQKLQQKKIDQGLNGDLINFKVIKTKSDSIKYDFREFFLPFKRLDLTYGWRARKLKKSSLFRNI